MPAAPAAAVSRLSERLGIPVGELRGYGAREQTRSDHLRDVASYLGWRQVDGVLMITGAGQLGRLGCLGGLGYQERQVLRPA